MPLLVIGKKEDIKKRLDFLIKNPFSLKEEDSSMLLTLIEKFPYFQAPKILLLKNSEYQKNDLSYLNLTAISTTQRHLLFNYVNYNKLFNISTDNLESSRNFSILEKEIPFYGWIQISQKSKQKNSIFNKEKKLSSNSINDFISNYSNINFLTCKKTPLKEKLHLEKPKILKEENLNMENFIAEGKFKEIITETLAYTYLKQKKYKIALKAYEILIDKYPEKKTFFVEKIQFIKQNIHLN